MKKLIFSGFTVTLLLAVLFSFAGNAQAKRIPDKKESNTPWISWTYSIEETTLSTWNMDPNPKRGETLKLELINTNDPHPLWYTLKSQYQVIKSNRLIQKLGLIYNTAAYIPEGNYKAFLKLYSKGKVEKSRLLGPLNLN